MLSQLKNYLAIINRNLRGWRTNRKIVVIESDDWGSIRMPSKEVYDICLKAGYRVDLNPYERYDSLASKEDLELLFDLLLSFKDVNGKHPVITANCVVANPDFERIKASNYKQYHYELITETFKHYPEHSKNFELWKKGHSLGVFHPQFHAREHLNVSKFLTAIQNSDPDVHFGFINKMPGCISKGTVNPSNLYVEATRFDSESDRKDKLDIYLDGLRLFNQLFGYESESIIPPNYTWDTSYNSVVQRLGVKYIQGQRKMRIPVPDSKSKYLSRVIGERDDNGLINLTRNISVEPSLSNLSRDVNKVLHEIELAFKFNKPAIISSHRINYIGYINVSNRDTNLKLLNQILDHALKKWPDIEFMTSDQLGNIIEKEHNDRYT
ncbi:MAG: polysaccharide (de)acetylase [Weeksellaceae bacterium]|nr:polysaccharide (de)acetylase [Weeksellaceae bacterium]